MPNVRRAKIEQDRRLRRMIYTTMGLGFALYLTVTLVFGENGLLKYFHLKRLRNDLARETALIEKQNRQLRKEIRALEEDPEKIEDLARKYRMVKEGELLFIFEE